jgi:hypothetical protein
MTELRRLSTLNMPFVFLSTLVNGNSCEIIELDGRLDHDVLRQAIAAAVRRHPVLNSRLRRRFLAYYWEEAENELPIDLRIEQDSGDGPAALHRRLMDNIWAEPLDLYNGRPARFHLTETQQGRSYLQLVTTHVWSDARAGYCLANDIATAYTALAEGRVPDMVRVDLSDRESTRILMGQAPESSWAYRFKALRCILRDLVANDRGLMLPRRRRGRTDTMKLELGADLLDRLRQGARQQGVTVHALLSTAMVRACQAQNVAKAGGSATEGGGIYRLLDLFSLRGYAREDAGDLYDTMVVPFCVRIDGSQSDDDMIADVARELERLKRGEIFTELFRQELYCLSAAMLPKRFATALVTRLIAKGNVVVTNPGPIPYAIDRFGAVPVADFHSFSQLFPPGRVMCIFSTFRQRLRLIVVYDTACFADIEQEFVRPFLMQVDRIVAHCLAGKALAAPTPEAAPAAAATAAAVSA